MNADGLVAAIFTAGPVEVALLGLGHDIVAASDRGALESVTTLLKNVLRQADKTVDDITLLGVCTGPGSFTGLRIGVAFAKSLAQTKDIPIVGVSAYDVATFNMSSFPVVAVARGKRDYYYARVLLGPTSAPQFIQGSKETIERAAAEHGAGGTSAPIAGPDFSAARPGDAARAVARLACRVPKSGAGLHWTNIAIDYGQRPNAVVNWEKRHPRF